MSLWKPIDIVYPLGGQLILILSYELIDKLLLILIIFKWIRKVIGIHQITDYLFTLFFRCYMLFLAFALCFLTIIMELNFVDSSMSFSRGYWWIINLKPFFQFFFSAFIQKHSVWILYSSLVLPSSWYFSFLWKYIWTLITFCWNRVKRRIWALWIFLVCIVGRIVFSIILRGLAFSFVLLNEFIHLIYQAAPSNIIWIISLFVLYLIL